jgi:hypothetical protein
VAGEYGQIHPVAVDPAADLLGGAAFENFGADGKLARRMLGLDARKMSSGLRALDFPAERIGLGRSGSIIRWLDRVEHGQLGPESFRERDRMRHDSISEGRAVDADADVMDGVTPLCVRSGLGSVFGGIHRSPPH